MFIFAPAIINRLATIVWNYHIMKQKRIPLVGGQYLVPFILITSLFFLWGFAHAILNVLNKHFQEILDITKTHSAFIQMAEAYYQLGDSTKADDMMKALADKAVEYLTWYLSMDDSRFAISTREFEYHWAVLDAEVKIMKKYNSKLAEIYAPKVKELYNLYVERLKQ